MSQKTKLLVSLAASLLLAAALGAYAYFGVFQKEQEELAAKETEGKLFTLDAEAIVSLEVEAEGETTTLEKRDGSWRITSPISARADDAAVTRLIGDLGRARYRRIVQEEGELRPFGLENPPIRVEARTEAGETAYIAVGLGNTFDATYFVSNGPGRVYIAESMVHSSLGKSTFHLRDKELVSLEAEEVERITIEGAKRVELSRTEGGWKLDAPREAPADEKEVDDLLGKLLAFRATAFPDHETTKLGEPLSILTLAPREGEARTIRFWEEGEKAYAQASGGDLAEIAASALEPLKKDPEELRDRRIAPFDTETIARMEVRTAEESFTVQRAGDGWTLTSPKEGPARRWKMNAGLENLAELRPEEVLPASAAADHGLEDPARTVRIFDAEGTLVGAYHFGAEEGSFAFVRIEGKDAVYKVRSRAIFNVPRSLADVEEAPEEG